ncbi:hypothetical protein SAMN04489717_2520 [Actinopolymorpha singaporensis]|uniref:Uncharacterized protein n=1 Tax=Actinopolymorpha singaporensis TaxID=117157 RepID=A0A1H1RRQ7_9ACTN|nr:hypothetical protein SAMN04489717_2520 [Actinopolymorpha singaporensis]
MVGDGENAWPTGQSALATFLTDKGQRGRNALSGSPFRLRDEV